MFTKYYPFKGFLLIYFIINAIMSKRHFYRNCNLSQSFISRKIKKGLCTVGFEQDMGAQ